MVPTLLFGLLLFVNDPRVVELQRTENQILGVLHLGKVSADEPIEVDFILKNSIDTELGIVRLAPSCACTNIELNKTLLKPGESSTSPGKVRIKPPKSRGKIVVATVQMYGIDPERPIGLFQIDAEVDRPFAIDKAEKSVTLTAESSVAVTMPLRVDPNIDVNSLRFKVNEQGLLRCTISRDTDGNENCILHLEGERETLLKARSVEVQVICTVPEKNIEISDAVRLFFYDGTKVRLIPANVRSDNGLVSIAIFRRGSIQLDKLECLTEAGVKLDAKFSRRTDSLVAAMIRLPENFPGGILLLTDGDFKSELTVTSTSNQSSQDTEKER